MLHLEALLGPARAIGVHNVDGRLDVGERLAAAGLTGELAGALDDGLLKRSPLLGVEPLLLVPQAHVVVGEPLVDEGAADQHRLVLADRRVVDAVMVGEELRAAQGQLRCVPAPFPRRSGVQMFSAHCPSGTLNVWVWWMTRDMSSDRLPLA